ncbi:MAG: carbonic anhydrase family protein [bacterium]
MLKNRTLLSLLILTSVSFQFSGFTAGMQSPIMLQSNGASVNISDLPDPEFHYPNNLKMDVTADHHTVKCTPVAGSKPAYMVLDGTRWDFKQFHTHTPGENCIDNKKAPLEIHMVHQDPVSQKLLVIGVLVKNGSTNTQSALTPLVSVLKKATHAATVSDPNHETNLEEPEKIGMVNLDLYAILPADKCTFRFPGSLTTPPYTEGVSWVVMRNAITVVPTFIQQVIKLTQPNTARETQNLNNRIIQLDSKDNKKPNIP